MKEEQGKGRGFKRFLEKFISIRFSTYKFDFLSVFKDAFIEPKFFLNEDHFKKMRETKERFEDVPAGTYDELR